ncbi:hypothetical protein B566_EDAN005573, partial [Ephemera danica]
MQHEEASVSARSECPFVSAVSEEDSACAKLWAGFGLGGVHCRSLCSTMMDVSKFCCKPPNPPPMHAPQKQQQQPQQQHLLPEQHNPVVLYVQQQGGGGGTFPAPPPPAPPQHAGDFQYHQQYPQQQPSPYQLQQGYGYQNDFYSQQPQPIRSKPKQQQQQQHVPTSCAPNSIYSSSKVNIFQNYYHQYEAEHKPDMEQPHTGYVATVTAVAGGSPNGNVSSSSYFSSNSSSPSASCLTPRSTSRCDSARSAESSCSSTDSGVEMSQQLLQLSASSFSSPVCTTVASNHSATPPNLVFVHQQQQQQQARHVPCTPPPLAPAPPTDIAVPSGWRRLLINNTIVYV